MALGSSFGFAFERICVICCLLIVSVIVSFALVACETLDLAASVSMPRTHLDVLRCDGRYPKGVEEDEKQQHRKQLLEGPGDA